MQKSGKSTPSESPPAESQIDEISLTIAGHFRLFIDECADPFFIHDDQGRVLDINRKACESLGYTRDELLKSNVRDFEAGFEQQHLLELWKGMVVGSIGAVEGVHKRRDGSTYPVDVRMGKVLVNERMYLVAVCRDVSDRKAKEEELNELNQNLLRSLAKEKLLTEQLTMQISLTRVLAESKSFKEAAPKLLATINTQSRWDFSHICGLDQSGQLSNFCAPPIGENRKSEFKELAQLLDSSIHNRESCPARSVWTSLEPLWIGDLQTDGRTSGRPSGINAVAWDLHTGVFFPIIGASGMLGVASVFSHSIRKPNPEILELFLSIGSQIGQFIERTRTEELAKAVTLMRQKEDFMAMLTHDLKNPILGANRILELLTSDALGPLSEQQREVIWQLHNSNRGLVSMVQNLITVYRYERDLAQAKFSHTDLSQLIQTCITMSDIHIKSKKIEMVRELPDKPLMADIDSESISRVIMNLLDNAVKYSDVSGKISVRLERLNLNECSIEITDTGEGLSEEEQASLFERFWQGIEGKKYAAGTGLSLYLSHQIIHAHGGTISCISKLKKGSTFTVRLPLKQNRLL